ncbi:phenylalanine--tRNA ligase subunit beta [Herpetosiphon giganteus]|uniref:phenylalanine--tRNA ligase subunit beta n=1 Tax=Herpetosiphon giganteus TaxID=2029754 RepID=UPI00195CF663|nr:phenylalanine--tRNA ligase subunit beta [Herpetosiphon giganteus]MBM7841634.1 phenylalanyl-tRNA synthetase beta chain [Herpetosiphon giganteus]
MRVPLSWLREFVDITMSPEELAERLTRAGLEVASIDYVGLQAPTGSAWAPDLSSATPPDYIPWDRETIFVGQIVDVQPHPNAERLKLPKIAYGEGRELTVVTGAPNIEFGMSGQKVVLATKGARLLDGHSETRQWLTLKPTKLRGVPSEGMVCSEMELALSDEHEGIIFLPDDAPVGMPLADYWGDAVLEIETTPNYAHTLSILGVAREVAAFTGGELRMPSFDLPSNGPAIADKIQVEIVDSSICPRFVAGLIEGVTIAPSPWWMQRRLRLAGQRPINNIADITNYVMLELGEPSHAFDADQVAQGRLIIRPAAAGEKLETLDHIVRELRPIDTVVADPNGPSSLAGVMGGAASEISDSTVNVLYEAALWNPIAIRRTAQHFKLFSEASKRFEKGVDPTLPPRTTIRGLNLIQQIAGGTIANGLVDVCPEPFSRREIELALGEVKRILGIELALTEVANLLSRLGYECAVVESSRGPALHVLVPAHRTDVEIEADLLEDVARMYGYDEIPEALMADTLPTQRANPLFEATERLRDMLVAAGLDEAISYSLSNETLQNSIYVSENGATAAQFVRLENPLTPDRSVMRRSILPELLNIVVGDLRERERVALFEIGAVFEPVAGQLLPDEPRNVALILAGTRQTSTWSQPEPEGFDFFDLKGVIEEVLRRHGLRERASFQVASDERLHPGRSAKIVVDEVEIGVFGELHPLVRDRFGFSVQRVCVAELSVDQLLKVSTQTKYASISRFPATVQDLALVANDELAADLIAKTIKQYGGEFLEDVRLFDVYTGAPIPAGQRSLAFRLRFRAPDRTLADKDLLKTREKLLKQLERELGVQIRS